MKLYYDMLIPFMPTKKIVDGKSEQDPRLTAARQTMVMLASFQNDHMLNALYDAVYQMSIYGETSIIDLLYSLGDEDIPAGKVDDVLDIEAKNLFKTVVSEDPYSFDYKHFVATLLIIGHTLLTYKEPDTSTVPNNAPSEVLDESAK